MKIFDQEISGETIKTLRFEKESINFKDITNPEQIECLEIAFCNLTDLAKINCLTKLRRISIYYCRFLRDISNISHLKDLEDIVLYSLPKVEINFKIDQLLKLESLSYTLVKEINSIQGIEKLPRLKYLGLSKVKIRDNDYSPIVHSKSLERIFWVGSAFQPPALQELRKLRPDIVIGGNSYNEIYLEKKNSSC